MPKVTKRKVPQESSEGEDFGNDDFSNFNNSSDDEFDSEPETMAEDPWKPIVISGNNKNEYVEVNISLLKKMILFQVHIIIGIEDV